MRDDANDPQGRAYGTAPTAEELRRDYAWQDVPPRVQRNVAALVVDADGLYEDYVGGVDIHLDYFNSRGVRGGKSGSWFDCRDRAGWGECFVPDDGSRPTAVFSGSEL